jgi:hypothetical protein
MRRENHRSQHSKTSLPVAPWRSNKEGRRKRLTVYVPSCAEYEGRWAAALCKSALAQEPGLWLPYLADKGGREKRAGQSASEQLTKGAIREDPASLRPPSKNGRGGGVGRDLQ